MKRNKEKQVSKRQMFVNLSTRDQPFFSFVDSQLERIEWTVGCHLWHDESRTEKRIRKLHGRNRQTIWGECREDDRQLEVSKEKSSTEKSTYNLSWVRRRRPTIWGKEKSSTEKSTDNLRWVYRNRQTNWAEYRPIDRQFKVSTVKLRDSSCTRSRRHPNQHPPGHLSPSSHITTLVENTLS